METSVEPGRRELRPTSLHSQERIHANRKAADMETPQQPSPPEGTGDGSGLSPNVAGALSYLFLALTGVVFLLIDRRPFVRFHALQSIAVAIVLVAAWVVLGIAGFVLGLVPILGTLIALLLTVVLSLVGLVLWLYLMYEAAQGREWEVPWIGEQVRNWM